MAFPHPHTPYHTLLSSPPLTHTCTDNPSPALQPLPPGHAGPGYSCTQDLSRPDDGEGERRILPQAALHCIRDPAVPQNGRRNQWVSQNVLNLTPNSDQWVSQNVLNPNPNP